MRYEKFSHANQRYQNTATGGTKLPLLSRNLTNIKILHAEYGGLVIYNMKLEKGAIKLPKIDEDDPSTRQEVAWSELVMMVQGIDLSQCERQGRWSPKNVEKSSK